LLDQMTMEHSHQEILEMLQTSTKPPIIAMDGSVNICLGAGRSRWYCVAQVLRASRWDSNQLIPFQSVCTVVRPSLSEFDG
jgi:hypothetical protein